MTQRPPIPDDPNALPRDGGEHFNRLVFESSFYLKSHAHQAIRWYPWGSVAFELAKIANKPIFLSIGYSSCHWCHVMSEQTFDRDDVAQMLNDHFVSIKVDRDQYPDIDQIYISATQLLTQHGGWPNSVFCLPTGQPFYAGTYFPPDDHSRGPGFLTLLKQLSQAWEHNHDEILKQAQELERVIQKMNHLQKEPHQSVGLQSRFLNALNGIESRMDMHHGGFRGAPKFPPYASLRLLIAKERFDPVHVTLKQMALSGLYDQVEGGFHRYSTDEEWHLPHFEKMLMDNAQMVELYSLMHAQAPCDLYERIVRETIDHLMAQWLMPNGGFISTIDADSDGGEGHYYMVSFDELSTLASPELVQQWADYFQCHRNGNMVDEVSGEHTGLNILHPQSDDCGFDLIEFRQALLSFRQQHRQAPQKDDAFVIANNAWLAKALYLAANVFGEKEWFSIADDVMHIIRNKIDTLPDRVYLDDVVYALSAALAKEDNLMECDFYWHHLMDRFYDDIQGGLWYSQEAHGTPMSRIKAIHDQAEPAPNGVFIECAFQLYQLTNNNQYYEKALDCMDAFMATVLSASFGCESYWLGVLSYWNGLSHAKGVRVQRSKCVIDDDLVSLIELDLCIDQGMYLMGEKGIVIDGVIDWLQCSVDPQTSRRMDWSDDIISCATGNVRFQARCRMASRPTQMLIKLPICSDAMCHEPIDLSIPIIDS